LRDHGESSKRKKTKGLHSLKKNRGKLRRGEKGKREIRRGEGLRERECGEKKGIDRIRGKEDFPRGTEKKWEEERRRRKGEPTGRWIGSLSKTPFGNSLS